MYKNSRLKERKVPIQLRQTGDAGDGGLNGEGSHGPLGGQTDPEQNLFLKIS